MKISKFVFCVLLLTTVLVYVGVAAAPPLKFTYKNVVATKTATETDSYGINDAGVIAGDYVDSAGVQHGMILNGTKLTTIDNKSCTTTPGSTSISFYGVNSAGTAAGWCLNTKGVEVGFTWAKGKFHNISIKGATLVNANGINDSGAVSGTYVDSAGAQHGFLLSGGKLTALNAPGGVTATYGWGINNKGAVTVYGVGSSGGYVSYVTTNKGKTYKQYAAPKQGADGTVIHAIANNGDIDGTYYDSAGDVHGWLYHAGSYYTLNDPTGCKCDTRDDGLNSKLQVVGRYSTTLGGASIGFEATGK